MSPKRFHYFFIAALSAFSLLVVVISYSFFLGVMHASDNLIIAGNSEDQLNRRITALQKLSDSMQSLDAPLTALHQAIPAQKDVPGLIADLEGAANATGVTISDLDFSAATNQAAKTTAPTPGATKISQLPTISKPAGPTPIPFKMEVVGSYAQTTNFVDRLTGLARYIDYSQMSLIKPHKEADQIDITFEANAYVQ